MKKITALIIICFMIISASACGANSAASDESVQTMEGNSTVLKSGKELKTEIFSFCGGRFSIEVPKEFSIMSNELIAEKYPKVDPPDFVFTNENTTLNVAVSLTDTKMTNAAIEKYVDYIKKTFSKSMEIKQTEIFEKSGHKIGKIQCISKAVDTQIYNHMLVFSDENKLRIITFNCTLALQEEWKSAADYIINSLKFA